MRKFREDVGSERIAGLGNIVMGKLQGSATGNGKAAAR